MGARCTCPACWLLAPNSTLKLLCNLCGSLLNPGAQTSCAHAWMDASARSHRWAWPEPHFMAGWPLTPVTRDRGLGQWVTRPAYCLYAPPYAARLQTVLSRPQDHWCSPKSSDSRLWGPSQLLSKQVPRVGTGHTHDPNEVTAGTGCLGSANAPYTGTRLGPGRGQA